MIRWSQSYDASWKYDSFYLHMYNHDSCPTCSYQDRLIVESDVEGGMWGSHLLRVLRFLLPTWKSVPMGWSRRVGGEVFGRWSIITRLMKDEGIMASSRAHNQCLIRVFFVPFGKGVRMQLSWLLFEGNSISFEEQRPKRSVSTGFQPGAKRYKSSSD